MNVLMLALYDSLSASTRIRLLQYRGYLENQGITSRVDYLLPSNSVFLVFKERASKTNYLIAAFVTFYVVLVAYLRRIKLLLLIRGFDLVIIHCEAFPFFPAFVERLLIRSPYIYDFDDAIYLKYISGRFSWLSPFLGKKIRYTIAKASEITAGSRLLCDYARRFNGKVTLVPSVADTSRLVPRRQGLTVDCTTHVVVGWIGSPTTSPYLELLIEPLKELSRYHDVKLLVVGGKAPSIKGVHIVEECWSHMKEQEFIQQFDIGVMPLTDTPWARGKCAYKLIQYMSCEVPVVASPVGANIDVIDASCGYLAKTNAEWLSYLLILADDPSLRARMGAAGRRRVLKHFSLQAASPILASVVNRTLQPRHT